MNRRHNLIFGILVVSSFVFLVTVLVVVFALSSKGQSVPEFLEPFMKYHIEFMIIMGVFGVGSGLVSYKLMDNQLQGQNQILENQQKVLQKQHTLVKSNTEILLRFLDEDERNLLRLLFDKDGVTTQSEISKLNGMTRLKAHRIVKQLEARKIIHVEKFGKINMIRLTDDLKSAISIVSKNETTADSTNSVNFSSEAELAQQNLR